MHRVQECPTSGVLWAEAISLAPRPARKGKSADALRACDNDPFVIAAVAQLFWNDRKNDKARTWFNRAVMLNPDIGDHWALWYKFEKQYGTPENVAQVGFGGGDEQVLGCLFFSWDATLLPVSGLGLGSALS